MSADCKVSAKTAKYHTPNAVRKAFVEALFMTSRSHHFGCLTDWPACLPHKNDASCTMERTQHVCCKAACLLCLHRASSVPACKTAENSANAYASVCLVRASNSIASVLTVTGGRGLQMHEQQRYNEIVFISDTCQAESLYGKISSPKIMSMASSKIGKLPDLCFNSCYVALCRLVIILLLQLCVCQAVCHTCSMANVLDA